MRLTFDKQMSAPAHIMLREELRKPLDDARANKGIREYLQMRDGPFQPEPFGPRSKKSASEESRSWQHGSTTPILQLQ